jgi:hypothetical protein
MLAKSAALSVGWLATGSRNRWLLWRDPLGRLMWFESRRVNIYLNKPANRGHAFQLLCRAFVHTGLAIDEVVIDEILRGIRQKSAHYVFPAGVTLPRLTINCFDRSNGIILKIGDRSHPSCVEAIVAYPDWAERIETIFNELMAAMRSSPGPPRKGLDPRELGYIC